ncbi:hypothetical protein GA0070606_5968 [Micromonospora citrea]|uniref:Uncharacterized protein n=1 Tax=Micromonospora citrea TaxID=47855 RepID=A0A1C6W0R7_9ACTN|nr:hypothetical protein [Micromonospora citrea]SCL72141.1 hypothetical protein GA0070606_5968 [Micromonospora citrea]
MNPGDTTAPTPAEERLADLRRWWRLPASARSEVRRLSRAGRHHPDREVAWVAWRWAQAVLPPGAPEPGHARNIVSAAGFWVMLLLDLVLGAEPTDPPEPRWLDRRRARRILRAGPPVA